MSGQALPERPLAPAICRQHELACGSTLAHLLGKRGGRSQKTLSLLLGRHPSLGTQANDAGLTPLMVAAASSVKTLNEAAVACWSVLERTILNPRWDRTDETHQASMVSQLREAIGRGADPAAHDAIGWTCLQATALCCEPRAAQALLENVGGSGGHDDDDLGEIDDSTNHAASGARLAEAAAATVRPLARASVRQVTAESERVVYATSRSGHTALLWANWMAWVSARPPELDDGSEAAQQQRASNVQVCARAHQIVELLAGRGALMRTRDEAGLANLKAAYERSDAKQRALLRLNPDALRVLGVPPVASGAAEVPLAERLGSLRNLRASQKYSFYPRNYRPPESLEAFLLRMEATHAWQTEDGRLFAPHFNGCMRTLISSSKLFLQDRIASGHVESPEAILSLHVYTLYTSIFREANAAMRSFDADGIAVWRPFIFYLTSALRGLNARSTVVFRGLKLNLCDEPTVEKFLDGRYPPSLPPEEVEETSKYHPGNVVLWPAFSSTTQVQTWIGLNPMSPNETRFLCA